MIDPELEALWRKADAHVRAPRGFEDRLFARIAATPPVRAALPLREPVAWWVRAAGERHVAAAFVVMGLLVAAPMAWLRAGASVSALALGAEALVAPWVAPLAHAPNAGFAVALAIAPALAFLSYRMALAIERRTMHVALKPRA